MAIVLAMMGSRRCEAGAERIEDGAQRENHLSGPKDSLEGGEVKGQKRIYEITYNKLKEENEGKS